VFHDLPKVAQLKQAFPARYREQPITTANTVELRRERPKSLGARAVLR